MGVHVGHASGLPMSRRCKSTRRSWADRRTVVGCAEICAALWNRYQQLVTGDDSGVLHAWRARGVATFGRGVQWESGGQTCRGVARDVDEAGALIVDTADGEARVASGEVRWLT